MHLKKTGNRLTFLLDIWNVRERKHTLKWKHIRWCKITTGLWASNVFCPTSVRNPGASEVTRHSHKGFFFNSMCKERGNTKINPSQSWIVHHTITHKPNNKKGKSYPCNRPWRAIGLWENTYNWNTNLPIKINIGVCQRDLMTEEGI